ncbi:MAG: transposase [Blastocatellia bacterium]|nr:transposase [Blastocatellia bacterium]
MWNDTDIPLAYFISFRSKGTWLHGDERGSTDRHNNIYGTPHIPANQNWLNHNRRKLIGAPVALDAARRRSINASIRETCTIRGWKLLAINIRTNHVHTVVSTGGKKGELALNAFKANATRQMRADGCWQNDRTPWADKGSCRRLWNEQSIANAIEYVLYGQGDDLPEF